MTAMDRFHSWFLGDADAVHFARQVWECAQVFDDVVDEGDVSRAGEVFSWIGFARHREPFAQRFPQINVSLEMMYLQWRDANVLERGSDADREKAFMLRAGIYSVFAYMAHLVGGEGHSRAVGPDIYRAYAERVSDLHEEFGG